MYRSKKESKRGIRFTILLCGASGTGKTSFVNTLLDENLLDHKFHGSKRGNIPKTITFTNLSTVNAIELQQKFDPTRASLEPGISITETSVEIVDEDDSKILLTIINTPGFGDNLNNDVCISELSNFLEQQFDLVLAEETKVNRNPRFQDTRVHLCLYFIEPTGHGLRELDINTMSRISKYVNILPVVSRADSFTPLELQAFKKSIMDDITKFKIPIFNFKVDEEEEDDADVIAESLYLSNLQPFSIITSDESIQTPSGETKRVRTYPWGVIDVMDAKNSDFPVLKSVVLGSHLQEFKDITHDFLYETYRTERLSNVTDLNTSVYDKEPSMSNLAEIANSKSMRKLTGDTAEEKDENEEEQDTHMDTIDEMAHDLLPNLTISSPVMAQSPQMSTHSSTFKQPHFDSMKLRKISETVPYVLRQESLRTKQAKLEDLERQSALELAKRAAELEQRAMALKVRERELKDKIDSSPASPVIQ